MRQLLTDLRGNPIYVMSRAARLRTRFRHPHLPTLFYLVQNSDWNNVLRRAKSHPEEVLVQEDVSKNTCLHVACRLNPPPDVVMALQKAARTKNAEGCTPLHIAASHRMSEPALRALLECAATQPLPGNTNTHHKPNAHHPVLFGQPDAYKSTHPTADLSRCGRAPIHYACLSFRGLELNAFRLLLEATLQDGHVIVDDEAYAKRLLGLDDFFNDDLMEDSNGNNNNDNVNQKSTGTLGSSSNTEPGNKKVMNVMTIRDATGQTPLGLLFRRYRERMRCVINTVDRLWQQHATAPQKASLAAAISVHAELGELWKRARFILARLTRDRLEHESGTALSTSKGNPLGELVLDDDQPLSPGELAIANEAASWAAEQHNMAPSDSAMFHLEESRDESPKRHGDENLAPTSSIATPKALPGKFRIVHASVGLIGYGCPPEMIRLAISLHPQQVKEMDEEGNLPIHIAATARSYLASHAPGGAAAPVAGAANDRSTLAAAAAIAVAASDEDSMVSDTDTTDITGVLSFFSSATVSQTINAFDKVIKILLQHYPESAKIPQGKTGRLPLVMAVEAGCRSWDDGIQTLLTAYPPALHNRKLFSFPLYANVLAMVADTGTGSNNKSMDTSGRKAPSSLRSNSWNQRSPRRRNHKKKSAKWEATSRKLTTMFELIKVKPDLLVSHRRAAAGE